MVLNIWVKYMKKNANKLEKIITILLFIIIIVGIYFNYEKENQTTEREGDFFVPVGFVFPDIVVRICSLIAFHAPFAGQGLGTIRRTTQCLIFFS